MSNMNNSDAATIRARAAANAHKTGATPPMATYAPVSNPKPTPLPGVVTITKTIDPGLAQLGRISQSVATGPKK